MVKSRMIRLGACLIFSVLVLIFPLDYTWSQTVQFGLGIGANHIQSEFVSLPHYWHPQDKWTFSAILHGIISLNDYFGFQSGLRFIQYGVNVQYDYTIIGGDLTDGTPGAFNFTQNHLALPLHFVFAFTSQPRFYLLVGPELGYLVSGRLGIGPVRRGITKNLNRLNLILSAGLGSQFNFSTLKFFVQGLYFVNMTDALKPDLTNFYLRSNYLRSNWRSSGLSVSIGYIF